MAEEVTIGGVRLVCGDALEVLRTLPDASVHAVVTDPPAGISFMGKEWDHHKGGRREWCAWMEQIAAECLRVIRPGGHALVWALPRTSHWTATAWEDAGWQVRDRLAHLFGGGFPKNRNALKPAVEDWWLFRRPLAEGTVAANVLAHGVGGLNIDQCRVPGVKDVPASPCRRDSAIYGKNSSVTTGDTPGFDPNVGRWPPNLLHSGDEQVLAAFQAFGSDKGGGFGVRGSGPVDRRTSYALRGQGQTVGYGDGPSTAARFFPSLGFAPDELRLFYSAKASGAERDYGLDGLPTVLAMRYGEKGQGPLPQQTPSKPVAQRNHHPTVKPVALMQWLCKLVTPPGGVVLDCFAGSGSTLVAASRLGMRAIGIEREAEYHAIAAERLRTDAPLLTAAPEPSEAAAEPGPWQASLFDEEAA
jgi:site-specific DNA-methyltransferase (adenine-specific)